MSDINSFKQKVNKVLQSQAFVSNESGAQKVQVPSNTMVNASARDKATPNSNVIKHYNLH
jgi:hypothetical protein